MLLVGAADAGFIDPAAQPVITERSSTLARACAAASAAAPARTPCSKTRPRSRLANRWCTKPTASAAIGPGVDGPGEGESEMMMLEHADQARLYVPVSQLHLISRWRGGAENAR